MRKILVLLLAAVLLYSCAFADSTIQLSDDGTQLSVTLPDSYDWYVEVEDENVVTVTSGGQDGDTHMIATDFSAVAPGSTRIRLSNDSYAVSVAVTVDDNNKIAVVGVTTAEGAVENVTTETGVEAPEELTVAINGTSWDYEIENEDVVSADDIVENEADDTSSVTFYGEEPGVSDIYLTNGIDEEVISVLVDEDGSVSLIDTTESDQNMAFYNTFETAVSGDNGEVLTLTHTGKVDAAVDDESILAVTETAYDEATDAWTGVFTAGQDGITDITLTNGTDTAVVSVFVSEGMIDSYWADCEEAVDMKAYINPNNYDTMRVYELYTDEEDLYVYGTLGTVTENGTEGFDEDNDAAYLYITEDAVITLPGVENATAEDILSLADGDENTYVTASIEMNADGDITSFTVADAQ